MQNQSLTNESYIELRYKIILTIMISIMMIFAWLSGTLVGLVFFGSPFFALLFLVTIIYSVTGLLEGRKILKEGKNISIVKKHIWGHALMILLTFINAFLMQSIIFSIYN